MALTLVHLADLPQVIPTIARWHFEQWGYLNPDKDVARRIEIFETEHLADGLVPSTWVALHDGQLAGSAGIEAQDHPERPDLTPWMVSVYVHPDLRGKGIGSALVRHVVAEAKRGGVETLWLYTPDQEALYARLGWERVEVVPYAGEDQVIMRIQP